MNDRSILAYISGAASGLLGLIGAWVPNVTLADALTISGILAAVTSTILGTQQIVHNYLDRRERKRKEKS
jgi:NhaP-type Na+/H+ or K+/H+ antiporter